MFQYFRNHKYEYLGCRSWVLGSLSRFLEINLFPPGFYTTGAQHVRIIISARRLLITYELNHDKEIFPLNSSNSIICSSNSIICAPTKTMLVMLFVCQSTDHYRNNYFSSALETKLLQWSVGGNTFSTYFNSSWRGNSLYTSQYCTSPLWIIHRYKINDIRSAGRLFHRRMCLQHLYITER